MRKLLIFVQHPFALWNAPAWFAERLRLEFPQMNVVHLPDYSGVDSEILDTEIAITWSIRAEQIEAATELRWIHCPAAAVHTLIFPEMVESQIQITNARDVYGSVVAEHVMTLIFALAYIIPDEVCLQHKHEWGQEKIMKRRSWWRVGAG